MTLNPVPLPALSFAILMCVASAAIAAGAPATDLCQRARVALSPDNVQRTGQSLSQQKEDLVRQLQNRRAPAP